MGHKIVVIYHHESKFGKKMAADLQAMGCRPFAYHDLDPLEESDFEKKNSVWRDDSVDSIIGDDRLKVLFYEHHYRDGEPNSPTRPPDDARRLVQLFSAVGNVRELLQEDAGERDDIALDFQTHVRSGVGLAIEEICRDLDAPAGSDWDYLKIREYDKIRNYEEVIREFRDIVPVKADSQFKEIKNQVDSSYCMIIRTGDSDCHPMAYFWLGYGHARGKHVIPVTVVKRRDERVDDLAFDIRAQRHMIFHEDAPDNFERELTTSLHQMIRGDFSEWSRRRFWNRMLDKRGEVSIFTGALHANEYGREMIGDWDLRSASELMKYFGQQQYRSTIESPVYTPEYPGHTESESAADELPNAKQSRLQREREGYVKSLKAMMAGKNCILIASPDVNPLTEIALGAMYDVPSEVLFSEGNDRTIAEFPNAMMVYKEKRPQDGGASAAAPRFFYKEEELNPLGPDGEPDESPEGSDRKPRRGFKSPQLRGGSLFEDFESQLDQQVNAYKVLGHVVILRNPFGKPTEDKEKYIIVLNGVSGPATFALTHVLTGSVTKEFVSYDTGFEPEVHSESIVRRILDSINDQPFESVEFIVDVTVGEDPKERQSGKTSDWRRILAWKLNETERRPAIKIMPPKDNKAMAGPAEFDRP
jgi:hypothetical protein